MVANRAKFISPPIAYAAIILFLSSLNQTIVAEYSYGVADFILHATEYHLFGVTLIWAIYRDKPAHELKTSFSLAVGVGTGMAVLDEFYQSFIPTRYSTIEDVVADVFGLVLSIITFKLLMKIHFLENFRTGA